MTDWLRHFPLQPKLHPDSWALNDLFLQKIKELMALWDESGYAIKLGSEIEFDIQTVDETTAFLKESCPAYAPYMPQMEDYIARHQEMQKHPPVDVTFYTGALDDVRDRLVNDPATGRLLKDTGWTFEEAIEHLLEIEHDLYSEDPKKTSTARRDVFMAWMHTRPFAEGGFGDLVEPRFGRHVAGLGWNDLNGPEIRTPTVDDPFEIISLYHKWIHILDQQSRRFGLLLYLGDSHAPQYHISIWRKSDGQNMMLMDHDEKTDFCHRGIKGYQEFLNEYSFMIQDMNPFTHLFHNYFSAGISRTEYVRQEDDNFEIRRWQDSTITHAARHLMMMLAGFAYGCLYPDNVTNIVISKQKEEKHLRIKHQHGKYISGIARLLEYSPIKEDGYLEPFPDDVTNFLPRLIKEVGQENLNAYAIQSKENPSAYFNLSTAAAWEDLFSRIRVREDNTLDLDFLGKDSELAEVLLTSKVVGRKSIISISKDYLDTAPHCADRYFNYLASAPSSRLFFSPYEQSLILSHYAHASQSVMRRTVDLSLDLMRATLEDPANRDCGYDDIAISSFYYSYLVPTYDSDLNLTAVSHMMAGTINHGKFYRNQIKSAPLYYAALRPHFDAAMADQKRNLNPRNAADREFLVTLDRMKRIMGMKPIRLQTDIEWQISDFLKAVATEKIGGSYGVNTHMMKRHIFHMMRHLHAPILLALRDPDYTSEEIYQELVRVRDNLDLTFRTNRYRTKIQTRDPLARDIYNFTEQIMRKSIDMMYYSMRKTLGLPEHDFLTGDVLPPQQGQKSGPAHPHGPA